jgi:uncharacterized protein (TIGR04255 family)
MVKRTHVERLPKAPLAEVVFELRWALQTDPGSPPILRTDPGLVPLLEGFTGRIKKAGYGTYKDMSPPSQTGAYGVARRFYLNSDKPFPIMQIGPGIFASNESSLYVWSTFKAQVRKGLRELLKSYPKLGFFAFTPNYLELRYIDIFDKSLLGRTDLFYFANQGTTLQIDLPAMLNDRERFSGQADGRIIVRRNLKEWKNSSFIMDFASGKNTETNEDIARLETKVVCGGAGVPKFTKSHPKFIREVMNWLQFARGITSPFFKQFMRPELMAKFQ